MRTRQRTLASVAGLALVIGCSVGKLFDAPPTKVIGVTPARVVDSAPAGSGASRAAALVLSTTGGDQPRAWTAHRATKAQWLFVSADSGSAPDTVELALDPTGLAPGIYRDTIVIVPDDPGAAQLPVPVELRIVDSSPPPPPPPPPPPATQLAFTGNPPASIVLNRTFSVEVTARDAQGATATGYSGTISLTLEGPVVAGGLSGTTSVNSVNGIATFSNLQVTGLCTSCTLRAAASGLAGASSTPFVVVSP
jgi:hypothetical protein